MGSVLVVPFGHRDVVGVVTGLADGSEHDPVAPRRVLEARLPAELVDLALWMAAEYCSTPARALSLLLPPKGTRAEDGAVGAAARAPDDGGERLNDRQRALLASLPRFAGGDLAALRRLEARGLVRHRAAHRAPRAAARPVGAARAQPELTADQAAALRRDRDRAARRAAAAARRHRLGQDRGLPAGGRGRARGAAAG